jgi:hypothetical protein
MKNFIKKPLKDWNLIDMGIASIGAIALIPVGFFVFCKGFDMMEKFDKKKTVKLSELEKDNEPIFEPYEEEDEG